MRLKHYLCALLACVAAGAAHAHETSTNYLAVDADGREVLVRWDIAVADVHWVLGLDVDSDGRIVWGEIEAQEPAIAALTTGALSVARGSEACDITFRDLMLTTRTGEPHVSVGLVARCPRGGALTLASSLLFAQDASQRSLVDVTTRRGRFTGLLSPGAPRWEEPEPASSPTGQLAAFVAQGMWHVWIGLDHIAFIALLLLPSVLRPTLRGWSAAGSWSAVARDVFKIVTAFTIAHSVTLILAATGTLVPPSGPIELAIACSIVAAGLANLVPRMASWRLPLALGFGLIHGFGFANALVELAPGGAHVPLLLAGFNIGVELGQLAIVALALPALLKLSRSRFYAVRLMPAASLLTALLGALWMVERWP